MNIRFGRSVFGDSFILVTENRSASFPLERKDFGIICTCNERPTKNSIQVSESGEHNERISRKTPKNCKNMSFPRTKNYVAETKNTVPISVCSEYVRSRGRISRFCRRNLRQNGHGRGEQNRPGQRKGEENRVVSVYSASAV